MKLLQAAIDLVAERGTDALEMKEVAGIARVSRAMAYRHFEDREHLLREAKRWISDRLMESVSDLQSASMEDQVHQAARMVLSHREASKLWITDALSGKALDPDHPFHQAVVGMLEDFSLSDNARSNIDVDALTSIMFGVVASMIMFGQKHEGGDVETLARRFTIEWTRILRHGLFVDGAQCAAAEPDSKVKPRQTSKVAAQTRPPARSASARRKTLK